MTQVMRPIYKACALKSGMLHPASYEALNLMPELPGPGSHKERCAIFTYELDNGTVFWKISHSVMKAFDKQFTTGGPHYVKSILKVLKAVLDDLDLQFVVSEVHDPKLDHLRSQVREYVARLRDSLNGSIQRELARSMSTST